MVATLAASATAMMIARAMLGDAIEFVVSPLTEPTVETIGAGLLLGVLLGVLGALYNRTILQTLDLAAMYTSALGPLRAAVIGGAVGLVAWFEPHLVGGGDPLIQATLDGQLSLSLSVMAIVLVARWLLGPLSYAAGTPGGLFAPLLVIGAVVGAMFFQIAGEALPGLAIDPTMGAIVGMAAFFTAIVRAPFTGILLALGMTGTIAPLLPVMVAALAANIVPFALGSAPIYDTLRERMERTMSQGPRI
jgi:CIC family chloride channel protein